MRSLVLAALLVLPGTSQESLRAILVALAVFAIPFVLLSGIAGWLADRISKRRIVITMKLLEIAVMAAGVTPGMRLAAPRVTGFACFSLMRISFESEPTAS